MAPKPSKFKPTPKSRKNVVLYPSSHVIDQLSDDALALKIARHSRCSACPDCAGLAPKGGVTVLPDSQWDVKVSGPTSYLAVCRCGHSIGEHAAAEDVPREEFRRRGRVAIRLDELLAVSIILPGTAKIVYHLLPGQKLPNEFRLQRRGYHFFTQANAPSG